jgi:Putative beta-barrel porin 2
MGTRTWVGLAIIMSLWAANLAVAADWSLVPSVTQKSEFNSNLNLTFTNPISDYIFTLAPAADFNYKTEITQLQGHVGLSGQHYITNSNLDHIDQNYQINGKYQATPKVNLSFNSSYIVDTTLLEELLASGLVIGRSPRTSVLANPGMTYNITERLSSTINYNFTRVLYQAPQYIDYTTHQMGLAFNYLLRNERTTLTNTNIVRETLYPGGNSYKTLGFYLGANHKFRENWEFNLLGGMNINKSDFATQVLDLSQFPFFISVQQKRVTHTKGTPYFNVSTTRRWTNLSVTAGFSRDQSPSAYGYVTNFTRIYASLGYTFTERLTGTLGGSYSLSTQASQANNLDYNYYNVTAQLAYKITEKLSVTPGYRFSQYDNVTAGQSAQAHSAYVMLNYTYPIHYQK